MQDGTADVAERVLYPVLCALWRTQSLYEDLYCFCPCRLVLFALLIAFYIVVAVAVAQTTNLGTQHVAAGTVWKCIPHPSWAWWLVRPLPTSRSTL
jgi:hypothetical protein